MAGQTPAAPERESRPVSEPTLRRLPSILQVLRTMAARGQDYVSCPQIGRELGLDPTQLRKDLAATGLIGRAKVGYELAEVIRSIETFLNWNNCTDAFLVGAGHLGTALLGYQGFEAYGTKIIAAFDTDGRKVGRHIHGREVLPIAKLAGLARRLHVHLGILTVPEEGAQAAADSLVACGIRAIWNFTPARLAVGDEVFVENVDLAAGLAVLSRRLADALKQQ